MGYPKGFWKDIGLKTPSGETIYYCGLTRSYCIFSELELLKNGWKSKKKK